MRVIVLGCGPAGLAAARTARILGHEVKIVSQSGTPSVLYGCQYLHAALPGFEDSQRTLVHYSLVGTAEEYRRKVYGEEWQGKVSPEDFAGDHYAWDIRQTYWRMWDRPGKGGQAIYIYKIKNGDLSSVRSMNPDKIISTIPATSLCHNPAHKFYDHLIYAKGSVEADGMPIDHVLCVGNSETTWYRSSNVFGYRTVEWPHSAEPIPQGAVPVNKPLSTDCDCHPDVIRAGRYGAWRKSFLVHQVPEAVMTALQS